MASRRHATPARSSPFSQPPFPSESPILPEHAVNVRPCSSIDPHFSPCPNTIADPCSAITVPKSLFAFSITSHPRLPHARVPRALLRSSADFITFGSPGGRSSAASASSDQGVEPSLAVADSSAPQARRISMHPGCAFRQARCSALLAGGRCAKKDRMCCVQRKLAYAEKASTRAALPRTRYFIVYLASLPWFVQMQYFLWCQHVDVVQQGKAKLKAHTPDRTKQNFSYSHLRETDQTCLAPSHEGLSFNAYCGIHSTPTSHLRDTVSD